MQSWNPWHGCHRISTGCKNCYVFSRDKEFGRDTEIIHKTGNFNLPLKKSRKGEFKLQPDGDLIFTCGTSDFFIEEADEWRKEAWSFIRQRTDLSFLIITKRIHRFTTSLPDDWGDGYDHVTIGCTCENQHLAEKRLPVFLDLPIKHRYIIHEPMLGPVSISPWLAAGKIEKVICGGESGNYGRLCDYAWILHSLTQCVEHNVSFQFKQTGTTFKKGMKVYTIDRQNQLTQAAKAHIDYK